MLKKAFDFSSDIDISQSKIVNLPEKIWVFGGKFRDNKIDNPASMRDFFWQRAFDAPPSPNTKWFAHLDRPENYNNWNAFTGYSDLHEFEFDACFLARSVILFLESAGSLAESGSLSIDNYLPSNLFLILKESYTRETSYLYLGPIKRITNSNGAICPVDDHKNMDDLTFQNITEHFELWQQPSPKKKTIDIKNKTHLLLTLSEIVNILIVSKIEELIKVLKGFNIDLPLDQLKKYLSLLDFFGYIRIKQRGYEFFYKSGSDEIPIWIDFQGINSKFDRMNFKSHRHEKIISDVRLKSILESN